MRVVWKDSNAREFKPIRYRRHVLTCYKGGWTTNIPGDDNIYKNHFCAQNAVDVALGGPNPKGPPSEKRRKYGIQIIGKKNGETA